MDDVVSKTYLKVVENKQANQDKHANRIRLQLNRSFNHEKAAKKSTKEDLEIYKLNQEKKHAKYQQKVDNRKSLTEQFKEKMALLNSKQHTRM